MKRCAIYRRVSTGAQEEFGTSLDGQLSACERRARERGYQVSGSFADTWSGAEYREREGLTRLRELVRAGRVDVVVCYALDRLSRNQAHLAILMEEFNDHGVRLELVTEEFEDSAVGRFIMSAKAFAAEIEREKFRDRSLLGKRTRVHSGKPLPGPRPLYGYQWSDETRAKLVIDPVTSVVVRRIYDEYIGGASLRRIAHNLTADRIPTPTGNAEWGPSSVRCVLLNEAYTGAARGFQWQTQTLPGTNGQPKRKVIRPRPEHEVVKLPKGTIPPLVTPEEFAAVAERLELNKRVARERRNVDPTASLLRGGVARCGICGKALAVDNGRGRYRCLQHFPSIAISRAVLEEAVWQRVEWIVLSDDAYREFTESVTRPDYGGELKSILGAMDRLERQRRNLLTLAEQATDDDTVAMVTGRLEELSNQIRDLQHEYTVVEDIERDAWELHQWLTAFGGWREQRAASLGELDYDGRRKLLGDLGISVTVWPASHEPRWIIESRVSGALAINTHSFRD